MPVNTYEGMFILDSNRYARDAGGVSGQITELVEKHGGTVQASRLWDERRLAYPINGQRKGTYWLTFFEIDSQNLAELTKECLRNDSFLRHLFIKHDPRVADHLVRLAQGLEESPEEEPEETPAEPAAEAGNTEETPAETAS